MRMFGLARLTSRERYVIDLLREADPADASGELPRLFDRLRRAARGIGYRAGPTGSRFVTAHELCLLGTLSGLQRGHIDVGIPIDTEVHRTALDCARVLASDGILLRHAAFVRLSGLPEACRELAIDLIPVRRRRISAGPITLPPPGTLQAKALHYVQRRGATSTRDPCDHGVSRQVVSLMHKRGVLLQVRTGLCRAAPETMRG